MNLCLYQHSVKRISSQLSLFDAFVYIINFFNKKVLLLSLHSFVSLPIECEPIPPS